jgi:hypothetical protein
MGFLRNTLAALETTATAFWVGSAAGFAFLSAPTVAHEANDLDLQARITGATLDKVAGAAYAAGGIAIGSALLTATISRDRRNNALVRAVCGAGALGLVAYHQSAIVPQMTGLQRAMGGSFEAVPQDDPNRVAYRAAHKDSTRIFGGALLLGIAQLMLGSGRSA